MSLCVNVCICARVSVHEQLPTVGQKLQWTSISFLPKTEINRPPSFISK